MVPKAKSSPKPTPKPTSGPAPRAYSYLRFSRPEQLKGDSLLRQTQASEAYAKEHGLELDTSLKLEDLGVSAFRSKNALEGALGGFLGAVQSGKVPKGSVLIVESLDRLSRDQVTSAMNQFLSIIMAGITVATLMDGMRYSEASIADNPGNLLFSLVAMMRAHDESASKSKRLVHVWSQKRKKAREENKPISSRCPAWIQLTKEEGYKIIPGRDEVIRRIFDMAVAGKSIYAIAKTFNEEGMEAWGDGIKSSRKGKGWHASYVRKILNNKSVLGIYQPHRIDAETGKRIPDGEEIPNYFPAVITYLQWEKTHPTPKQASGRKGGKNGTISNLFGGLVIDGYTGERMRFVDKGRQKGDGRYLVSDIKRIKPGSKGQTWPYAHLENTVLKYLTDLDWSSLVQSTSYEEVFNLENLCAQYRIELERLTKVIDKLVNDFVGADVPASLLEHTKEMTFAKSLEKERIQKALATAEAQLQSLVASETSMTEGIEEFKALVGAGDPESRQSLRHEIRKRIKQIVLYRHGHAPMFQGLADEEGVINRPIIEYHLANGTRKATWLTRIGPAPWDHHARKQPRDPKTGAFLKQSP